MPPVTRRIVVGAAVIVGLVLSIPPAGAENVPVPIRDNYFSVPFRVVTVGDRVTWRNEGSSQHTVRSYPGAPFSFDSSPDTNDGNCTPLLGTRDCIEPGRTFRVSFDTPGTYEYYCKVTGHADPSVRPDPDISNGREQPCGMCGVIVVREESSPEPNVRSPSPEPSERSPSPSPSPSESGSESSDPDASLEPVEPLDPDEPVGSSGAGGRLAIAFGSVVVLAGAGYVIWQRFLAPR